MSGRLFHHSEFSDAARLAGRKSGPVSVCIPTLDEAATIGSIVETIRRELVENTGLVDEILVIDSGSSDDTLRIAADAGATAVPSASIAPRHGTFRGKGENLWKALHLARGTVLCFIDGDISEFCPRFVTGPLGPLLVDPTVDYVKAHYKRPLSSVHGLHPNGGGRVSEILVRPLLSLFYPELSSIFQPLSGEYAARREVLERLSFPTGYGVEIAHLIDLLHLGKAGNIAQTDLDQRIHRNRDDTDLGRMSFAILRTIFRRLERDGKLSLAGELPEIHRTWCQTGAGTQEILTPLPETERPPLKRSRGK